MANQHEAQVVTENSGHGEGHLPQYNQTPHRTLVYSQRFASRNELGFSCQWEPWYLNQDRNPEFAVSVKVWL